MSDDNVVKFPTKDRKDDVMRERNSKSNDFSGPFTNPNYRFGKFVVDGVDWQKWPLPEFNLSNDDNISFEDVNWSFNLTNSNRPIVEEAMDLCNAIQKQCIGLSVDNDVTQLNIVLDKLREALALSKISFK